MELLRFITCGSVDDGKNTLIGRILYDSKALCAIRWPPGSVRGRPDYGGRMNKMGFVSLVGAGPGHPDVLTIKGARVLAEAEAPHVGS